MTPRLAGGRRATRTLFLAAAFALLRGEGDARATVCPAGVPWLDGWRFVDLKVPIDARPWLHVPCELREVDAAFGTCRFVSPDHEVSVALEPDGVEACSLDPDAHFLLTLVPARPLVAGRTYRWICEGPDADRYQGTTLRTRSDETLSAPPEPLAVRSAVVTQRDPDGFCCGDLGDLLEIDLAGDGEEPAFLAEGGLIEAQFSDGRVYWIDRYYGGDVELALPPARGAVELTPISLSGARGEATRVEERERRRELVYEPCQIGARGASRSLWIVLPVLWIFARRRSGGR